jgi:hypothetical protein
MSRRPVAPFAPAAERHASRPGASVQPVASTLVYRLPDQTTGVLVDQEDHAPIAGPDLRDGRPRERRRNQRTDEPQSAIDDESLTIKR